MMDTGDTRRTTHDGRQTTPQVWHKLPTGELKITEMPHDFSIPDIWYHTAVTCRSKLIFLANLGTLTEQPS